MGRVREYISGGEELALYALGNLNADETVAGSISFLDKHANQPTTNKVLAAFCILLGCQV